MSAASGGDRPAVVAGEQSLTAAGLLELAGTAAERFRRYPAVLYLGTNHLAYPVALFGAALAGVPFVPLNYRLGEEQRAGLLARHPGALVLRAGDLDSLLDATRAGETSAPVGGVVPGESSGGDGLPSPGGQDDDDSVAVVLYTSGSTAAPKAALLRHRHLLAYVWNTVEFGAADESHTALVSVPPYHVAGLANLLTNLYAGRRVVYPPSFSPGEWLEAVRRERVTHALLVPTVRGGRSLASTGARARWTPGDGSRRGTPDGWIRTGTCSSRAGPTTRSSAAARTSLRPRSRTFC